MFKSIIQLLESLDQLIEAIFSPEDVGECFVIFFFLSAYTMICLMFMKVVFNVDIVSKIKSFLLTLLTKIFWVGNCGFRSESSNQKIDSSENKPQETSEKPLKNSSGRKFALAKDERRKMKKCDSPAMVIGWSLSKN